jgi:hypothetical protein
VDIAVGVVRELKAKVPSRITRKHEIGQRDDEVASLRIDLLERLKTQVIAVRLRTDAIELQCRLRASTRRDEDDHGKGDGEA